MVNVAEFYVKCAESRLVGRNSLRKLLILAFYVFFSPVLKLSKNKADIYYCKPLNRRVDQQSYDLLYCRALLKKNPGSGIVEAKYNFDGRFLLNLFSVLMGAIKLESPTLEKLLSIILMEKEYDFSTINKLSRSSEVYLMNEANFEFQLMIHQLKEKVNLPRLICLQHATYPEYSELYLNEAQVAYYLSSCDQYILWDNFTADQYRASGFNGLIQVKGRPYERRFEKYRRNSHSLSDKQYLFFLAGTHELDRNKNIINELKAAGLLQFFCFALHPNDKGELYERDANVSFSGNNLNDFDVVFSFSSTVIVELIAAEVPLVTIQGERYREYGYYVDLKNQSELIGYILRNEDVSPACPNLNLYAETWEL